MGWSNFIIVKDLKLIFEITRYVDEENVEEFIKQLDELVELAEDNETFVELYNIKYTELTISDLSKLAMTAEKSYLLFCGFEYDLLLLAWLKNREIDFEIVSEFDFDIKKYKKEGYKIIWWS